MPALSRLVSRPLRALLSHARSNRLLRNLLSDLNNTAEFTSMVSHERMVADRVRMDNYHAAIRKHVKPGQVVIDLGTGTGVLAMFAAQAGARKIYALDHSPFIEVARRLAAHNKIDCIDFIAVNSREFVPQEAVDLIIHEQLGDECFNENMVENLLDLKSKALKPGGRILPARFGFFVEPLQLKAGREVPPLWQQAVHGVDFSCLKDDAQANSYKPDDYGHYFIGESTFGKWLSQPAPALQIDLDTMDPMAQLPQFLDLERRIVEPGVLDGFAIYFRINFDDEIAFDTAPSSPPTHWGCRFLRADRRALQPGDTLNYRLIMTNPVKPFDWFVDIDDQRP